ncbi:MAG: hypothetical protein AAFT19_02600 [Pseudomonadota bacterium]
MTPIIVLMIVVCVSVPLAIVVGNALIIPGAGLIAALSLLLGAPSYLLLGGAAWYWYLNRRPATAPFLWVETICVGFLANLGTPFLYGGLSLLFGGDPSEAALSAFAGGATFGCLNSAIFGLAYANAHSDFQRFRKGVRS